MAGIGLPGHFLCRFQSSRAEIYIDAFHGGRVLVKADCVKMVMQLQHRFDDSFLAPVSAAAHSAAHLRRPPPEL